MANIIPTDARETYIPARLTHKIDGKEYVVSADAIREEFGADHLANVVAYLMARGLTETLNNAWSTQGPDKSHEPVAKRLRRIIANPGDRGRGESDPIVREALGSARAFLMKSGGMTAADAGKIKTDEAATAALTAYYATKESDPDRAARKGAAHWDKFLSDASAVVAIRLRAASAEVDIDI